MFRNQSGQGGAEDWSVRPTARRPDQPDSPVTGRFLGQVPASQFQLNDVAAKLRNTSNYQPIAHFAWQQTASSWGSGAGFTVAKVGANAPGLSGLIFSRPARICIWHVLSYQRPTRPPASAPRRAPRS